MQLFVVCTNIDCCICSFLSVNADFLRLLLRLSNTVYFWLPYLILLNMCHTLSNRFGLVVWRKSKASLFIRYDSLLGRFVNRAWRYLLFHSFMRLVLRLLLTLEHVKRQVNSQEMDLWPIPTHFGISGWLAINIKLRALRVFVSCLYLSLRWRYLSLSFWLKWLVIGSFERCNWAPTNNPWPWGWACFALWVNDALCLLKSRILLWVKLL